MAMNFGTHNGTNEAVAEMNTAPLIDVMLVLLVMLIVTLPIQTHAVKLDMTSGNPVNISSPVVHTLGVEFDGAMTWDGAPMPSLPALDRQFARIARQPRQDLVEVLPNRLANYGLVARIMGDAQRIGVKRIGFAGEEQYQR